MYIEEELVFSNVKVNDQNELFDFIADKLEKKDYVTTGFREAIKKREKEFPTGLALEDMNVAIVHTETQYAKTDKLVVLRPEDSIVFQNIENHDPLHVDLIIGLILHDNEKHLNVLKKLSELLQNKQTIQQLKNIQENKDLFIFMEKQFNTQTGRNQ